MENLGQITNVEVIRRFLDLKDKRVMDAGCGAMTFTKVLAEEGARIIAFDPDSVQADKNQAESIAGIEFVEAGADKMPAEDGSIDGVFFSYSLHHVPAELYPKVFSEVQRVLRAGGFLYVIEPIDCPMNQVMKLFYDEDELRAAAWNSLQQLACPMFESRQTVTYYGVTQYDSWDHYATNYTNRSFNSLYSEADVRCPEVEEAFHRLGGARTSI